MAEARESCRLYLVVEPGTATADGLAAALSAVSVAAVLIEAADRPLEAATARALIDISQQGSAVALIEADAGLARALRADGVHVPWRKGVVAAYTQVRETVGASAIVGAHGGKSRHDAMELGEAGADYVAFGVPVAVRDVDRARARRFDLTAWWSEVFAVPCVAFDVESPEEAAELAAAGADFVGVRLRLARAPARLAEIAAALKQTTTD